MRCEKCKYITKTTCQCPFGYEQASKEFIDGNCEKFIDKYKEEYTPIIAEQIFAEIKQLLKKNRAEKFYLFGVMIPRNFNLNLENDIAELKKKYIGE